MSIVMPLLAVLISVGLMLAVMFLVRRGLDHQLRDMEEKDQDDERKMVSFENLDSVLKSKNLEPAEFSQMIRRRATALKYQKYYRERPGSVLLDFDEDLLVEFLELLFEDGLLEMEDPVDQVEEPVIPAVTEEDAEALAVQAVEDASAVPKVTWIEGDEPETDVEPGTERVSIEDLLASFGSAATTPVASPTPSTPVEVETETGGSVLIPRTYTEPTSGFGDSSFDSSDSGSNSGSNSGDSDSSGD